MIPWRRQLSLVFEHHKKLCFRGFRNNKSRKKRTHAPIKSIVNLTSHQYSKNINHSIKPKSLLTQRTKKQPMKNSPTRHTRLKKRQQKTAPQAPAWSIGRFPATFDMSPQSWFRNLRRRTPEPQIEALGEENPSWRRLSGSGSGFAKKKPRKNKILSPKGRFPLVTPSV